MLFVCIEIFLKKVSFQYIWNVCVDGDANCKGFANVLCINVNRDFVDLDVVETWTIHRGEAKPFCRPPKEMLSSGLKIELKK